MLLLEQTTKKVLFLFFGVGLDEDTLSAGGLSLVLSVRLAVLVLDASDLEKDNTVRHEMDTKCAIKLDSSLEINA